MTKYMRATSAAADLANSSGRIVRYVLSDDSVARDGHTINTRGWVLENYLRNPVFMWAHDTSLPPIGRLLDVPVINGKLMGDVEYMDAEVSPFADTIFRMVKAQYLNAVSVSWDPLEWKYSQDKSRMGGIDFLRQDLLEVSQVPVPALASALATARANGINTAPISDWASRVLDEGGMVMVPRLQLENLRSAAIMPRYAPNRRAAPRKRGLYDVSWLAELVQSLGYLASYSSEEEEWEGDNSKVPEMLLDALKQLGAALVAMTQEEVAGLLAGLGGDLPVLIDDAALDTFVAAAPTPAQRMLRGLEVALRRKRGGTASNLPGPLDAMVRQLQGSYLRAGRVLSQENEQTLRAVHGQISEACDSILAICDAASSTNDPTDPPASVEDDEEAQARARRAQLAQVRARQAVTD